MFSYAFTAWHSAKKCVGYARKARTSATTSWPLNVNFWVAVHSACVSGHPPSSHSTFSRSLTPQCIDMIWQNAGVPSGFQSAPFL